MGGGAVNEQTMGHSTITTPTRAGKTGPNLPPHRLHYGALGSGCPRPISSKTILAVPRERFALTTTQSLPVTTKIKQVFSQLCRVHQSISSFWQCLLVQDVLLHPVIHPAVENLSHILCLCLGSFLLALHAHHFLSRHTLYSRQQIRRRGDNDPGCRIEIEKS